jgi:hypothetical protein
MTEGREATMGKILILTLITTVCIACSPRQAIREEFEMSVKKYNDTIRWHDMNSASLFAAESLDEEFRARVRVAKNVQVVEYRILRTKYNEEKGEAEVQVEIDYYHLSSNRLKTLVDTQKWAYIKEDGEKHWRLMSLLPEFP